MHKGNKIYSSNNCILVPQKINILFTNNKVNRSKYYLGVRPKNNKFRASISIGILKPNKQKYSKCYDTPEEAFYWYKKEKEQYIKDVADLYKSKYPEFPQKLYDAMYAYEVEITD